MLPGPATADGPRQLAGDYFNLHQCVYSSEAEVPVAGAAGRGRPSRPWTVPLLSGTKALSRT
ncbi:hypothetical protein ACFYZ4_39455 [Streptomyces sp. NPDC001513]|uniref:hypothetical protein n=1 Tax=Streptomyces sp. NPDC001513 TaxID=3364580 RepID=UPI00369B2830